MNYTNQNVGKIIEEEIYNGRTHQQYIMRSLVLYIQEVVWVERKKEKQLLSVSISYTAYCSIRITAIKYPTHITYFII